MYASFKVMQYIIYIMLYYIMLYIYLHNSISHLLQTIILSIIDVYLPSGSICPYSEFEIKSVMLVSKPLLSNFNETMMLILYILLSYSLYDRVVINCVIYFVCFVFALI